jgi:hypothetical protein
MAMTASDDRKVAVQNALQAAFHQCEAVGSPLNDVQRQIIQQVAQTMILKVIANPAQSFKSNPLEDLPIEQRQALLDYVAECNRNAQDWKTILFNDWIQGRHSGAVQFLRDRYGLDWVNQIQPHHLADYLDTPLTQLNLGDRIEVSSRLWEWIPDQTNEEPEWVICTLIHLQENQDTEIPHLDGTVQFENGMELNITGLNEWNQNNWRLPQTLPPALESD